MVDDLKEYAEKYYTDEEYETLRQKYDFAQPLSLIHIWFAPRSVTPSCARKPSFASCIESVRPV